MTCGPAVVRRAVALAAVAAAMAAVAPSGAAAVRVSFVQGEQHVVATRDGDGLAAAVDALMAGPTPAERRRQVRSYVLPRTPVRALTQAGTVATIDVGARFVAGTDSDTLLARLSQLVSTATAVPGVRSVQVLVEGGVPLGLFPGIDATRPLTPRALRTPDVAPPSPSAVDPSPATDRTRQAQERLVALGYLPAGGADGQVGPATTAAVIAFQKWEGLQRDGVLGPRTLARLRTAVRPAPRTRRGPGRRMEVLVDRQVALAIDDDRVVRTLHVSSGKPSTPTPIGAFRVYAQYARWWSVPFREWLLWASPFVGGVAFHQFPEVPVYAASHGCVRVPEANARWLYGFLSVGTPVQTIASSR